MKNALLYLLVFAYTVILLKPALPAIADTMAHIFWYTEHMATVHYEHGKYHVHTENIAEAKKGYPEKNNLLKPGAETSDHVLTVQHYHLSIYPFQQSRLAYTLLHFLLSSVAYTVSPQKQYNK